MGSLGWALIQNDFILIKKGDLDTEIPTGRKPCGEEGRDRDNASVRQGTPAMASEPPEDRGQAWDRLSLLERNSSADTGVLDFQPPDCEKLSFFYCKPPSWWLCSPSQLAQVQRILGTSLMGNRIFTQSQSLPWTFPNGSVVKNLPANAGDMGSIHGSGRSPGEGNGNPLQYSCLGKPWTEEPGRLQFMAGSQKNQTQLSDWTTTKHFPQIIYYYERTTGHHSTGQEPGSTQLNQVISHGTTWCWIPPGVMGQYQNTTYAAKIHNLNPIMRTHWTNPN